MRDTELNDRRNCNARWRTEDVRYINEHPLATVEHLALKFGRSKGAIRAIKTRLKKQRQMDEKNKQLQYKSVYLLHREGMWFKAVFDTKQDAEQYQKEQEMWDFTIEQIAYYHN